MAESSLRIANAGGFWGDDPYALRRQVQGPLALDYISIDYLAEVTMSILQKQKQKDERAGYARDFITQIEPLLEELLQRRIKVITNAGGVNPHACAEALAEVARARGLELRVAVVEGDDITTRLNELRTLGMAFQNMETGESFAPHADKVLSANAYFGAGAVAAALKGDPDIVLCGRVTDTGITLGPLIHAFGWAVDDWDRLASGIVAGHLIECGAQATGGNFTDWRKVPSFADMGFPILECAADGSFVLTKHPGSGGLVTCQTVREQLLYEMGDPRSYLTPDVIADFSTIRLDQEGPDRVRISGVRGRPPTELLKVSLAFTDGYKASGAIILSGPDARAKATAFAQIFWERCTNELQKAGLTPLEGTSTEGIGDDATHRGLTPEHVPVEILLRLSARSSRKPALEVFRKLVPALILSGPPGVAITGGAPVISEVVSYWPALIPRGAALPSVQLLEERGTGQLETVLSTSPIPWVSPTGEIAGGAHPADPWSPLAAAGSLIRVPLMRIAHARSGDKGDTANIGLIGRSPECYAWMREHVTAVQVKNWFRTLCQGTVERYPVPNLWALNFLLEASLGGGGTRSLFLDAQGKTLAQALLRCEVELPEGLLVSIQPGDGPCRGELIETGGAS